MPKKSDEFINNLLILADKYIDECLGHTISKLSNSRKVVKVADRHIPTIDFFLRIWMPRNCSETISRETWYTWLKQDGTVQSDTIRKINTEFSALATDIVANEGKGVFYAKNKLGMTDKVEQNVNMEQSLFGPDINK